MPQNQQGQNLNQHQEHHHEHHGHQEHHQHADLSAIQKELQLFAATQSQQDVVTEQKDSETYQPYPSDPAEEARRLLAEYAQKHPMFITSFKRFNARVGEILKPSDPNCPRDSSSSDSDLPPLPPPNCGPDNPPKKRRNCCRCVVS